MHTAATRVCRRHKDPNARKPLHRLRMLTVQYAHNKQVPAETCTPQHCAAAAPHTSCHVHNSLTFHPSCGLRPSDHPKKHAQPPSALALPTDPWRLRRQQLLQLLGAASPVDQAPKLLDITLQGPGGSVEVKAQATLGRILQERTSVLQAGRHTHTHTLSSDLDPPPCVSVFAPRMQPTCYRTATGGVDAELALLKHACVLLRAGVCIAGCQHNSRCAAS